VAESVTVAASAPVQHCRWRHDPMIWLGRWSQSAPSCPCDLLRSTHEQVQAPTVLRLSSAATEEWWSRPCLQSWRDFVCIVLLKHWGPAGLLPPNVGFWSASCNRLSLGHRNIDDSYSAWKDHGVGAASTHVRIQRSLSATQPAGPQISLRSDSVECQE